jgi:hypothetical protein
MAFRRSLQSRNELFDNRPSGIRNSCNLCGIHAVPFAPMLDLLGDIFPPPRNKSVNIAIFGFTAFYIFTGPLFGAQCLLFLWDEAYLVNFVRFGNKAVLNQAQLAGMTVNLCLRCSEVETIDACRTQ